MKDTLISFKTAILAKEKGFDLECLHFYCKNSTCDYIEKPYKYSFEVNANREEYRDGKVDNFGYGLTWSAPTQSLLQKWLRDIHDIDVMLSRENCLDTPRTGFSTCVLTVDKGSFFSWGLGGTHKTYEEALEQGLIKALELIE